MSNSKEKIILIVTILFFVVIAFSLAWIERKQADPNMGREWWSLYFVEPKTESMNFVVENHTQENKFHWEVWLDNEKIQEGDFQIKPGGKNEFTGLNLDIDSIQEEKITIKIRNKKTEGEREIYKTFSK